MTSPTTQHTPLFALPYLAPGQPMHETRQVTEDLAETLEAVLQTVAVSPPGASDLLAVAGRVSALEADQAAEDALYVPQSVTFASGVAGQFSTSPYGELVKCWKEHPTVVRVVGLLGIASTISGGTSTPTTVFTLPSGYRPAAQLLRLSYFQTAANAPVPFRIQVTTAGLVQVTPHVQLAAGQWLQFDFAFRTVNT